MLMISFAIATRILRKDFDTAFLQAIFFFLLMFDAFLFIGIAAGVFAFLAK